VLGRDHPIDREERRALCIKGYCNYRLGGDDPARYDQCLRDFQAVLDTQPPEGDPWRAYATASLKTVKRWLSLEEKTVDFTENRLTSDWTVDESHGVRVGPDEGWVVMKDMNRAAGATDDGKEEAPTAVLKGRKLFGKDSLESVQVRVAVPRKDTTVNNVVFGVVVQPPSGDGKGLARNQGFGVFYDRGKVAVRIGGGTDPAYRDGALHRVKKDGAEVDWPSDAEDVAVVEIERGGEDGTQLTIRLNGQEVLSDRVASFRRSKSEQELWIGGWSNKAANWDIRVDRVRVVSDTGVNFRMNPNTGGLIIS
jgi:hypothetical protein